jgi:hypothetical protein
MSENCIVVEEPFFVKVIRYKKIDLDEQKPRTWYERKLTGWTAPISNLLGRRLAEKRYRADKHKKSIKVRTL